MPRLLTVVSLVSWSLACSGWSSGGGGGGGGSFGGGGEPAEEEPGDELGGGRKAKGGGGGGKAKHGRPDGKAKHGKGGGGRGDDDDDRGGRGGDGRGDDDDDRGGRGDDDDDRGGRGDDDDDDQKGSFTCVAEGVYRVCAVEGKPATCVDETTSAGGPGTTRKEAEANAIEACDLHMDTLVSAADSGKGSAEVRKRCELERCEED